MEDENDFGLWPKQVHVLESVRDAPLTGVEEIFLIGPVGSTKTFAMACCHINVAWEFPRSIIPVGRKDMSDSQIGTWEEYTKALRLLGYVEGRDYSIRQAPNDLRIRFKNGSIIQFIGMNQSRDREFSKLKITATMAGVDEVDDVEEAGYDMLYSRTGRRNENGAPRVMLSCCNPNDKWTKRKIYLPWLKSIGRRPDNMSDEEWDQIEPLSPKKMVIEFTMEDSPLLLTGYYDRYADRPRNWRERYLHNNWSYIDDENSLFKYRAMDRLTIRYIQEGRRYIGVDPNAGGKDRAAIVLWEGDCIADIELYTTAELIKAAEPDELQPQPNYGAILGRKTIEMAKRERVGARFIGGDVNGVGQAWLTYMLTKGYDVRRFVAGASPYVSATDKARKVKPPYGILRDQVFHQWSIDIENGRTYFYIDCPHLPILKKELQYHEGDTSEKVMRVTPKDAIKVLLGGSPDVADAAVIGWWVRMITASAVGVSSNSVAVGQSYEDMYNEA